MTNNFTTTIATANTIVSTTIEVMPVNSNKFAYDHMTNVSEYVINDVKTIKPYMVSIYTVVQVEDNEYKHLDAVLFFMDKAEAEKAIHNNDSYVYELSVR